MIIMMSIFPEEKTSPTRYKMYHVKKSFIHVFLFSTNRSPKAALLFQLQPHTPDDPHTVHKPLPGPHHHLHHLHQRHHHVPRALQSTSRKKEWLPVCTKTVFPTGRGLNTYFAQRPVTDVHEETRAGECGPGYFLWTLSTDVPLNTSRAGCQ